MGNEYAISRLANDGRPRFYTYSNILWQTAVRTLGDDDLEAVTSEAIGDETLYHVTFAASAVDYLEAVLVTHGAVEVETLPLPDTLLESLGNESELEGAMRRHPAGGSTYTVSPVTFEATLEPCYPCKVNARLALAACLGSFVAACIALAAVLVAS